MEIVPQIDRFENPYLLNHFLRRIPTEVFATNNHELGQWLTPKGEAIYMQEIGLNTETITWALTFDIDRPDAISSWEIAGLPVPSIAVVNPENGHTHLTYLLHSPVSYGETSRKAPQRLLARICWLMKVALKSDLAYTGQLTHNPLSTDRTVYISGARAYRLKELIEPAQAFANEADRVWAEQRKDRAARARGATSNALPGERNSSIFDVARAFAYMEVNKHESIETFCKAITDKVIGLNRALEIPLPEGEERSIAGSIMRFTWRNKEHFESKAKPVDEKRGVAGALASAAAKVEATRDAICRAVKEVVEASGQIVMSAIATVAGISERTARRYRAWIDECAGELLAEPAISKPAYQDSSTVGIVLGSKIVISQRDLLIGGIENVISDLESTDLIEQLEFTKHPAEFHRTTFGSDEQQTQQALDLVRAEGSGCSWNSDARARATREILELNNRLPADRSECLESQPSNPRSARKSLEPDSEPCQPLNVLSRALRAFSNQLRSRLPATRLEPLDSS